MVNEALRKIMENDDLLGRVAYVLWDGGMTAEGALWQAERVTDLLIDMAGRGQLLKAIDRCSR